VTSTAALPARLSLSDQVSLRDESFGALAYHHGNRRLVFLKTPLLVDVVRQLDEYPNVDDALAALVAPAQHASYRAALASLLNSEILCGH